MRNNDLSNEITRRMLVTTDVVLTYSVAIEKKLLIIPVVKKTASFNRAMLSRLYMFNNDAGVSLELAGFNMDDEELGKLIEEIDELGTNPFRYYTAYESIEHLVGELPYRPEVIGVLDIPERLLMYGHWGMDYTKL